MVVATEAALTNALFVTNNGSIIPLSIIFTIFPVTTSIPKPSLVGNSVFKPAFSRIILNGSVIDLASTSSPTFSLSIFVAALSNAFFYCGFRSTDSVFYSISFFF